MIAKRKLKGTEKAFLIPGFQHNILMAIKFEDHKSTEKAYNNLEKMVAGLHLKVDKDYLCKTDEPTITNVLPRHITDPRHAIEWTFLHNLYPITIRLGSIAFSEYYNLVVLNISRLVSGNSLMKVYLKNCLSNEVPSACNISSIPIFIDKALTQSIESYQKGIKNNFFSKKNQIDKFSFSSHSNYMPIDAKSNKNMNNKNKLNGKMTDCLYSSWTSSMVSIEHITNINGKIRAYLSYNIRSRLNNPKNLSFGLYNDTLRASNNMFL